MQQIKLIDLENTMESVVNTSPLHPTTLKVAPLPDPYVPPTLHIEEGELPAEVVFVKAPAAVGKTITAQYLSARRNAPLLDLAEVAVGTGSFQGLLSEYFEDGREAFHRGELPIVIDALDEGRILSGETSFEAFLESTVAFLTSNRIQTSRPKLIFLGREESAELSKVAVGIEDDRISICTLILDFFYENDAAKLIDVYALKELERLVENGEIRLEDRQRRIRLLASEPMHELKEAYFSAIEGALEVRNGNLWQDDRGRTFAGYAPVLASIGTLLASVENPVPVTNKLLGAATRQAWDVIDTVIQEIMQREKGKLLDKLTELKKIPEHAYDPPEQLTYLTQLLTGSRQISLVDNLKFASNADRNKYFESASQICTEHPFIRSGRMANDVLGSIILAHAVCNGTGVDDETIQPLVRDLATGPFLWRSIRRELDGEDDSILEGKFVGYTFASYWNDPLEGIDGNQRLRIRELDDGLLAATIGLVGQSEMGFGAVPPLLVYGRVRNAEIDTPGSDLTIEGTTLGRSSSSSLFYFQGESTIRCRELRYGAKWTDFSGSLWLEASAVNVMAVDPETRIERDFIYGWGGAVKNSEPWRHLAGGSLVSPYFRSPVAEFFSICRSNIPANGIVLLDDYTVPEDDNRLVWTNRYRGLFSPFVKLLVEEGFADRRSVASKRSENKFRIMVSHVPWEDIQEICRGNQSPNEDARHLVETVTEAMRAIGLDG